MGRLSGFVACGGKLDGVATSSSVDLLEREPGTFRRGAAVPARK